MAELFDLQKKFDGAKVKKNSIKEIQDVILEIHDNFDTFSIPDIRSWIRRIKNMHPLIDEYIEKLEFFQPVSEEMGSRTILHTPDTPSLDLADWANDWLYINYVLLPYIEANIPMAPVPMHSLLIEKTKQARVNMINFAYTSVNSMMVDNISKEFLDDVAERPPANIAHGFHLAGDVGYTVDTLDTDYGALSPIKKEIKAGLTTYLGKITKLINHQYPVVQSIKVGDVDGNPTRTIKTVEGKQILVDIKGNKLTSNTGANDDVLISKPEGSGRERLQGLGDYPNGTGTAGTV